MNTPSITFCVSVFNDNLDYLRLCIKSLHKHSHFFLKENSKNTRLIIVNEHKEGHDLNNFEMWFEKLKKLYPHIKIDYYKQIPPNPKKYELGYYSGIGGGMNACADYAPPETDYLIFFHSDFFLSKNWDLECLKIFEKYPNEKLWVSSQRFQPNLFQENSRPGTIVFDYEEFGYKHDNFKEDYFIEYAEEFSKLNSNIEYEKGEGVSGMIRKKDWDYLGGNDPRFKPAYWEDSDIFLRAQLANYKFILTTNSVVFHFGSRSAHSNFPDDTKILLNQPAIRSKESIEYETNSGKKFIEKWGFLPEKNKDGFVTFPQNQDTSRFQHLIQITDKNLNTYQLLTHFNKL